ncbi:MAG: hypothetical protein ABL961_02175 [Vicinamibacterales bacterium]
MKISTVVDRVRAEFDEMPGMRLTVPQASRLFGLDEALCRTVVEELISAEYLRRLEGGAVTKAVRS